MGPFVCLSQRLILHYVSRGKYFQPVGSIQTSEWCDFASVQIERLVCSGTCPGWHLGVATYWCVISGSLCCRVLMCQWEQWWWAGFLRWMWGFRMSVPGLENSAWHMKALCTRSLVLELVAWDHVFQGPLFCDYIRCDQPSSSRFSLWFLRPQFSFRHTVSTHTYLWLSCAGNKCPSNFSFPLSALRDCVRSIY